MENLNGNCKQAWHIGPVQIGYIYGIHIEAKAEKAIAIRDILTEVCRQTGLTRARLLGRNRSYDEAHPRQLAMLLIRELCPNLSAPAIGRTFDRDHTTILHGIKQARDRIQWDDDYRDIYHTVRTSLGVPVPSSEQIRFCMFCGDKFLSRGPDNRLCSGENCKNRRQARSSSMGD